MGFSYCQVFERREAKERGREEKELKLIEEAKHKLLLLFVFVFLGL